MTNVNKSIRQLLAGLWGVQTTTDVDRLVTSVPTSSVKLCKNNPGRTGLIIVNHGATSMYIDIHDPAITSHGLLLAANGGTIFFDWQRDFNLVTEAWYGISVGAANAIAIYETYIVS